MSDRSRLPPDPMPGAPSDALADPAGEPAPDPASELAPDPASELGPGPAGELVPDPADELAAMVGGAQVGTPRPPVSRCTAAVVSVAAGLTFAALTIWVAQRGATPPGVDEHLHRWAISQRGPDTIAVARAVRWGGVTWVVLPALVAVGAATSAAGRDLGRRLGSGLVLCLTASVGVYAETAINHIVGRARPPVSDWAGAAGGASFPSGHTTTATMFALSCAWAISARVPAGWPRRAVWAAAAAYAATVGWSRIWLGVHWPTDVAGAWLYSTAWMAGSIAVILTLRRRFAARRTPGPAQAAR